MRLHPFPLFWFGATGSLRRHGDAAAAAAPWRGADPAAEGIGACAVHLYLLTGFKRKCV